MQKGNIGVTTENIFPIIKKFLYSDHEIFLRELVSNAVDATQKLKTLASKGEFKGEMGDLTIKVSLGKDTITISDRGIGLTAEEIDKYINQIAFSGANDFLEKYKDDANAIIGHFGLGFYSAFMVAKKVEIITKSHQEGAQAVKWTCDGSPEFTIENVEKESRGSDIILYIDDDCKEFLEETRISSLLTKYCRFLPIPIAFGKKKEWKDGKYVDTEEDNIINDTNPLWTRKPSELKEEDYQKFYRELYPMAQDPLFHIHLNVDYPFNLTGILYFPKIDNKFEIQKSTEFNGGMGIENLGGAIYDMLKNFKEPLLFDAMIRGWRNAFHHYLPFYFVQITPWSGYADKNAAYLREQQADVAATLRNTGMVVAGDLVNDLTDIHPSLKRQVGERLANMALKNSYHKEDIQPYSPMLKSFRVDGRKVIVTTTAIGKLACKDKVIRHFEVLDKEGNLHPAKASILKNGDISVIADKVKEPVGVRYCFSNDAMPNLFDSNGLPLAPFRTDRKK